MTQKDYQLLLKDLCARLPYSPFVQLMEKFDDEDSEHFREIHNLSTYDIELFNSDEISNIKPYLRPMSSMTDEEKETYYNLCYEEEREELEFGEWAARIHYHDTIDSIDYLNSIHIDYRGLISKGLAISTEKFNPYL